MEDSQFKPNGHEEAAPPPIAADPGSVASRKSRKKIIFLVGALIAGLFLCAVLCVVVVGTGAIKGTLERNDVEQVIDEFMGAMARKDIDAAYALFSTRAKRTASRSQLEELLRGNNFALFDGYKSAQIINLNLSTVFQTNPDLPQGMVAKVNGTLTYERGFIGSFDAVLEQGNKEWRLFRINITIPPEKMGE